MMKCVRRRLRPGIVAMAGLLGLMSACAVTGGGSGRVPGKEYVLTLDKALPGGRPMTLYLGEQDGVFNSGFGLTPRYNRASHDVDPMGLKRKGDRISGTVIITVRADMWVPGHGCPVQCRYTVDATVQDAKVTGAFSGIYGEAVLPGEAHPKPPEVKKVEVSGSVAGTVMAMQSHRSPLRAELNMEDVFVMRKLGEGMGHGADNTRGTLRFSLYKGKGDWGVFDNGATPTYWGWAGFVDDMEMILGPDRSLTGHSTINLHFGRGREGLWTYRFKGYALGGTAAGQYTVEKNGKAMRTRSFFGPCGPEDALDARNCHYWVSLQGGVPGRGKLILRMATRDGKPLVGLALCAPFSRANNLPDLSELTVTDSSIKGRLKVQMVPDRWTVNGGNGGMDTKGEYEIDAKIDGRNVRGKYSGSFAGVDVGRSRIEGDVAGIVDGELLPSVPRVERAGFRMTMNRHSDKADPLFDFDLVSGAVNGDRVEVTALRNRKGIPCRIESSTLTYEPERITGTVKARTGKEGQETPFTMRIDGVIFGGFVGGRYSLSRGDRKVGNGSFKGNTFQP